MKILLQPEIFVLVGIGVCICLYLIIYGITGMIAKRKKKTL